MFFTGPVHVGPMRNLQHLYRIDDERHEVVVLRIEHRSSAYRRR